MTTPTKRPWPLPCPRALRRAAVPLLLLVALTACHDSGGSVTIGGGGGGPGGPRLIVDFGLRTDLLLGLAFLGDLRHADLDGDGIEDLVETNFLPQFVTIALGNIDGTFTTIAQLATVGHGLRLDLGDVDGDGMLDIAVASQEYQGSGAATVEVFLQGPNPGEFSAPAITLGLAADPLDITCAPITGITGDPGPVELFLALESAREVARVSLDAGGNLVQTGSLDSSATGVTGGPISVAIVDLGADGLLDLVVGEENLPGGLPDRVIQYARTAAGFQGAAEVTSPTFFPLVDNAGDVDGNGYDDVAVAQAGANEVLLLMGDGAGLTQMVSIDFGAPTTSLIFPDLDGDGLAEAVGTTLYQNSVQVHVGTGPMLWDPPVHYNVGPVPRAIDTLLLPGDPIPDLLCGNAQDLSIMIGLGAADFRAARGYDTLSRQGVSEVQTADLDNDGDADAVTISRDHRSVSFLEGLGDGRFQTAVVLPLMPTALDKPGHVIIVDLDVDGNLDVLTSVVELDEVRLYRGDGTVGGFTDPLPVDVFPVGSEPLGIATADLNGDTQPDLLVCNSGDGTIQTLLNVGGGVLAPQPAMPLSFAPEGVLLAELDGDGDIDAVIFGSSAGGYLTAILEGDGMGGFTQRTTYPLNGPSDNMTMGDLNEDGRLDVVVGQTDSTLDVLFVLTNQGGFAFDSQPVQVAPGPATVVVADLNNDGDLDLLVATTPGELKMLFGDGSGTFPAVVPGPGELPVPHQTLAMSYVDLNGDLLEDLVMVSIQTPFVWVAFNTSLPQP